MDHLANDALVGAHLPEIPADPRVILRANLSHGIGTSPFDSPLVEDSVAAAMLVRFRQCVPDQDAARYRRRSPETARYLERLRAGGLLVEREGRLCTAFPIVLEDDQAAYARITSDVADQALEFLDGQLDVILGAVRERGWRDWQYHFVWSQLFDSQAAWVAMTERGLVPPISRLIAWSVYPDHPYRTGTNYYPDTELRDHWIMVTWRPGASRGLSAVDDRWDVLYDLALQARVVPDDQRDTLQSLGLVDDTGTMPVLRSGDQLLATLGAVAVGYVGFLERALPLDSLTVLTGAEPRHTFAMAYHDVSWSILERLVESGRLEVPPGLDPGRRGGAVSLQGVMAIAPVQEEFARQLREVLKGG